MRAAVPEGDAVPVIRDGEGSGAEQGLLQVCDGVEGQRSGLPLLHNPAGAQRLQRRREEHGVAGDAPPPAALRLSARQCQRHRVSQ